MFLRTRKRFPRSACFVRTSTQRASPWVVPSGPCPRSMRLRHPLPLRSACVLMFCHSCPQLHRGPGCYPSGQPADACGSHPRLPGVPSQHPALLLLPDVLTGPGALHRRHGHPGWARLPPRMWRMACDDVGVDTHTLTFCRHPRSCRSPPGRPSRSLPSPSIR